MKVNRGKVSIRSTAGVASYAPILKLLHSKITDCLDIQYRDGKANGNRNDCN